jgi:hypothetical protein
VAKTKQTDPLYAVLKALGTAVAKLQARVDKVEALTFYNRKVLCKLLLALPDKPLLERKRRG